MIEKYLLLTMQMSSASFTYTIYMSWIGFCCSIICIARLGEDLTIYCHLWLQSGILLFVIVPWLMFLSHTHRC
ncbi:hypothetical protein NC652_041054 [Populus alba x Populus x berolinensis]|nr:hypothetical protein NC652_041054 [Populus alba x Populus x berolinensis]